MSKKIPKQLQAQPSNEADGDNVVDLSPPTVEEVAIFLGMSFCPLQHTQIQTGQLPRLHRRVRCSWTTPVRWLVVRGDETLRDFQRLGEYIRSPPHHALAYAC